MSTTRQTLSLLFVVLVLLVTESHSLRQQQQDTMNDGRATGLEVLRARDQLDVLRRLSECSTSCSLREKEVQEMRKLMNELKDFKTTITKEMQNMTAMVNDFNEKKEETSQALSEVKETIVKVSRLAASFPECEEGWSKYFLSCYKVFKTRVTQVEATDNCQAHGAYLASIGNEGEHTFVHGLIESRTYIGLSDENEEGVFTWQDGFPFQYSKWCPTEPPQPNGREKQNCVVMSTASCWRDTNCESIKHYVCEKRLH